MFKRGNGVYGNGDKKDRMEDETKTHIMIQRNTRIIAASVNFYTTTKLLLKATCYLTALESFRVTKCYS